MFTFILLTAVFVQSITLVDLFLISGYCCDCLCVTTYTPIDFLVIRIFSIAIMCWVWRWFSQGRPSPSNWCNSRWSSGHLLPSSQSSSSVSSQVSSPSSAPSFGNEDAWDTLYAAAGEVLKLNVHEKKISALSNDGPPPSIVCHKALRGQTQQSRTSGHHGRNSPSHSARKLEECITFNKQVCNVFV